jgi:hypothetical protein
MRREAATQLASWRAAQNGQEQSLVVYDLDGPSTPLPAFLRHVDFVGYVESVQRLWRSRVGSRLAELYGYLRYTAKFIAVFLGDGLARGSTVNQALLYVVGFGAGSQ